MLDRRDFVVKQSAYRNKSQVNKNYLFFEFIDNFLSHVIENNISGAELEIVFNKKEGYISFEDNGNGFDVISALNFGYDNKKDGKISEYGLGMKQAFETLTNFSLIISEQKKNGRYRREMSDFISNAKPLQNPINLEPNNISGSEIYLFSDFYKFKEFILNKVKFLNSDDKKDYLEQLDSINKQILNKEDSVFRILNEIEEISPIIISYIFERYKNTENELLKNKGLNFKIKFKLFDDNGHLHEFNSWNNSDVTVPFFSTIEKNNYFKYNTFSWKQLQKIILNNSEDYNLALLLKFLENEKNLKIFKEKFELFLLEKVDNYLNKEAIKEEVFDDFSKLVFFRNEVSYKNNFINKKWFEKKYFLAKEVLEPIFDGFVRIFTNDINENDFYMIDFDLKKLTIENNCIKKGTDGTNFDLSYSFFINSDDFNFKDEERINLKIDDFTSGYITGFEVFKNYRNIMHGPNEQKIKTSNFEKITAKNRASFLNEMIYGGPSKFMYEEIFNSGSKNKYLMLPVKDSKEFNIKIGGNIGSFSKNIHGVIRIPDETFFQTTSNKALIDNSTELANITSQIIKISAFPVASAAIHSFAMLNSAKKPDFSKLFFFNFIQENLRNYNIMKKSESEEINREIIYKKPDLLFRNFSALPLIKYSAKLDLSQKINNIKEFIKEDKSDYKLEAICKKHGVIVRIEDCGDSYKVSYNEEIDTHKKTELISVIYDNLINSHLVLEHSEFISYLIQSK